MTGGTAGVTAGAQGTRLAARSDPWQGAGSSGSAFLPFPLWRDGKSRPFPTKPRSRLPVAPPLEPHPCCTPGISSLWMLRGRDPPAEFLQRHKTFGSEGRRDVTWKGETGKGHVAAAWKSLSPRVSGSLEGIIQMRAGNCRQGGARNRFIFSFSC